MKVLLVDDDVFLRDMYAAKFNECKHQVQAVGQASEALNILEKETNFDVVLVDMVMPGMTGVELLTSIREKNLLNEATCIMLSNQGQQADIDEAIEAGAKSYIVKAEHLPSEVVQKVEKILQEVSSENNK